jgi:ribose-phosphate pyrophosphokinase
VQSTVFPANDHFMELLFWIDAFKRASAASVTAVIPYFSYAKGDKKDEPRVSIRARVCADADPVVVAPDAGFAKKTRMYARRLGAPLAIADKVRSGHDEQARVIDVIGEVAGRDAVLVDDFTISAGTLVEAAEQLDRLLITTDSVETQPVELSARVRVVSAAPLFAEAIRRIHNRESISGLFND